MSALAAELRRIAEAIEAGELTADQQQRVVASASRQLDYARRDALIVEVRQRFFGGLNDREASNRIAIGIRRYETSAWRRDRSAPECPARIAGTDQGMYWHILRLAPRSLSADRIRVIVVHGQ
jgi:hypothetical protein